MLTEDSGPVLACPPGRLYGVPAARFAESPASWFARVALSQGLTPKQLANHFDLNPKADIDFVLAEGGLANVLQGCGMAGTTFATAQRVFAGLLQIPSATPLLLMGTGAEARVRYCVACLKAMPVPYFFLHWRFDCWQHCPTHNCLLRDRCPHCRAPVLLMPSLVSGGPRRDGVGLLSRCVRCDKSLTAVASTPVGPDFGTWRLRMLDHGRAVLAALLHGYLRVEGEPGRLPLRTLVNMHRRGLIPCGSAPWMQAKS